MTWLTGRQSGTPQLLGWVVDVQRDFMDPDGRLYVHDLTDPTDPGARMARGAIVRAVTWMRARCATIVFTGDWHAYGDREIDSVAPDPLKGTYPPHCMGMSPDPREREGASLLPEIAPNESALVLSRHATEVEARAVARDAVRSARPVFLQKSEFSCFSGNSGTDTLLAELAAVLGESFEVLVCGVATDVCVRHAVEGMLDRGLAVSVIRDATWGLGLLPSSETWDRWRSRGARVLRMGDLERAGS